MTITRNIFTTLLLCMFLTSGAQEAGTTPLSHPASFTVSTNDFEKILNMKPEEILLMPDVKLFNGAQVIMNTRNGDMQFVRLQLKKLEDAWLQIQVNGIYSTQVFVMSDAESLFYKGSFKDDTLLMEKCEKDDIVVE